MDELKEEIIINDFDYSNIVPVIDGVNYLVQYLYSCYMDYLGLLEEGKRRNESLSYEYRNYDYKDSFSKFRVSITKKDNGMINCNNYEQYLNLVQSEKTMRLKEVEISITMNYERGQGRNTITCKNSFVVKFAPYDITFQRKSNYKDEYMDKIENFTNEILNKFNRVNTIFCSK